MKTVMYFVICVLLTILLMAYLGNSFSKRHEVQRIVEAGKDLSRPFGAGPLVSIVWYKGWGQAPYKIFSDRKDIKDIHYRLKYIGLKSTAKNKVSDFEQRDILAFVYYSNKQDSYRMQYIPFKIDGDTFYWSYGEDKKVAQILMAKETWSPPPGYIDPSVRNYLDKKTEIEEELGIEYKLKKINQIKKSLSEKDQMNQHELEIFKTCDLAEKNLMGIVSLSARAEMLDDILSRLNQDELRESLVHAFVQLPEFIIKDYSKLLKPEYVRAIRQFSEKYDYEGLSREEQVELFHIHQELNGRILDELQRRQDDFERILQINESHQKLAENEKQKGK